MSEDNQAMQKMFMSQVIDSIRYKNEFCEWYRVNKYLIPWWMTNNLARKLMLKAFIAGAKSKEIAKE